MTNDKQNRIVARVNALLAVVALGLSGQQPISDLEKKFDQCTSECLREINDTELRDSLATNIRIIRTAIAALAGNASSGTPIVTGDLSAAPQPSP